MKDGIDAELAHVQKRGHHSPVLALVPEQRPVEKELVFVEQVQLAAKGCQCNPAQVVPAHRWNAKKVIHVGPTAGIQ